MKRSIFAIFIALLTLSCTESHTEIIDGGEVAPTEFTVALADVDTRSFGEGSNVDTLLIDFYDTDGNRLTTLCGSQSINNEGHFIFSRDLVKNMKYNIVFWAQDAECKAYTLGADKCITVDYSKIAANSDNADAFFGYAENFDPITSGKHFTLSRPFAQLNVGTSDFAVMEREGFTDFKSSVTLTAHNCFDIAAGDVTGEKVNVALTATAIPAQSEAFPVGGYRYLSMNYLLAPKLGTLTNASYTITALNNKSESVTIPDTNYSAVPLQQNYRTNIIGALLTNPTAFDVDFNAGFGNSTNHHVVPANEVWYTTASGNPLPIDESGLFDATCISNSYNTDQGCFVATFDAPVTAINGMSDLDISNEEVALRLDITSLRIPEGVTSIGTGAFVLTSIEEFTIPSSVTTVGEALFAGCPNLKAIHSTNSSDDERCLVVGGVLNSVALAGLTEYTLPADVLAVGLLSFALYSQSATKITIPDSVQGIYPMAFYATQTIEEVVIGNGVTSLEGDTFSYSAALTTVTFEGELTYSGSDFTGTFKHAFDSCPNLATFNGPQTSADHRCLIINKELAEIALAGIGSEYSIPAGIESVADKTFSYSQGINKITFGNDVKRVGGEVLFGSEGVTEVVIGDNVETIGSSAFDECNSIKTVTIGKSVKYIGQHAFWANTGNSSYSPITRVNISSLSAWCNIEFENLDSNPLYEGYADLYLNGTKVEGVLTLPSDIAALKDYTFYNYDAITSVVIPDNINSVGVCAFTLCSNLSSFSGKFVAAGDNRVLIYDDTLVAFASKDVALQYTLPEVKNIQQYAFAGSQFTEVTLHDSVESIERDAFDFCTALTKVTLSKNLESIGSFAFMNCHSLTDVYCRNSTPATIGSTIFGRNPNIYVPTGSLDAYKTAWSHYYSQVTHNFSEYTVQ